jgi:hypothetical protein
LIFIPADATWSWTAFWRERSRRLPPAFIHPWPRGLLLAQLTMLYLMNGVYKILGPGWLSGDTLYYVTHDVWWCRWSPDWFPVPFFVTQALTWLVLAWELAFPLLVMHRWGRPVALAFGALFHIGSGVMLNLGMFPVYALCFYLPELPWGAWRDGWTAAVGFFFRRIGKSARSLAK